MYIRLVEESVAGRVYLILLTQHMLGLQRAIPDADRPPRDLLLPPKLLKTSLPCVRIVLIPTLQSTEPLVDYSVKL